MTARLVAALAVVCLAFAACGGDEGPGSVELYDPAPVPGVPDRTAVVDPAMTTLAPDGEYWADLVGGTNGDIPTITFLLTQALFADACDEVLGVAGCTNGYGVIDVPHATVIVTRADIGSVTVVAKSRQNFAVTPKELYILAGGEPPSDAAPDGYMYVPFPFLLSVRDGKIVEARQIWLP